MAARDSSNFSPTATDLTMASWNLGLLGRQAPQDGSDNTLAAARNSGMPVPSSIINFYIRKSHDPWNPLAATPSDGTSRQAVQMPGAQRYYPNSYNFQDFRSTGQPSECGTLPVDSGYGGSRPKYSVESTSSIHDDDQGLDAQMMGQVGHFMDSFHLNAETQNPQNASFKHFCTECNAKLRTQSEVNKHAQRHAKPHRCPYPNCGRSIEGFGTSNDLSRHKNTVHKEHDSWYICLYGNCRRKEPSKRWPRADNFRSHLARVHHQQISDAELAQFRQSSTSLPNGVEGVVSAATASPEAWPTQSQESRDMLREHTLAQTLQPLSGIGLSEPAGPALSDFAFQPSLSPETSSPAPSSICHNQVQCIQADVLQGPGGDVASESHAKNQGEQSFMEELQQDGGGSAMDFVDENEGPGVLAETDGPKAPETPYEGAGTVPTPADDAEWTGSQPCTPASESKDLLFAGLFPQMNANPSQFLESLKSLPKELLESALEAKATGPTPSKVQHACPACAKSFNRPCELKKHMKRHDKPYGCTFRDCIKVFGSKNDWKRHESIQHYQLETWNCDEGDCNKICHRRESFRNHLDKDHSMTDARLVEEKLEECRTGRHCHTQFWCGFCEVFIGIEQEGVNWWTKRCDHIDGHLFGKGGLEKKSMKDWRYIEELDERHDGSGSRQRLQPSSAASGMSKSTDRKRKGEDRADRRPPKKPNHGRNQYYIWQCCNCSMVENWKTSSICSDCGHQRCKFDNFELRVDYEDDGGDEIMQ